MKFRGARLRLDLFLLIFVPMKSMFTIFSIINVNGQFYSAGSRNGKYNGLTNGVASNGLSNGGYSGSVYNGVSTVPRPAPAVYQPQTPR